VTVEWNPHAVEPGQVWRSWDTRERHKDVPRLVVEHVLAPGPGQRFGQAVVRREYSDGRVGRDGEPLRGRIRLDRFKERSNGYRKVEG